MFRLLAHKLIAGPKIRMVGSTGLTYVKGDLRAFLDGERLSSNAEFDFA